MLLIEPKIRLEHLQLGDGRGLPQKHRLCRRRYYGFPSLGAYNTWRYLEPSGPLLGNALVKRNVTRRAAGAQTLQKTKDFEPSGLLLALAKRNVMRWAGNAQTLQKARILGPSTPS